jgi:hypothetical protein
MALFRLENDMNEYRKKGISNCAMCKTLISEIEPNLTMSMTDLEETHSLPYNLTAFN